MGILAWIVFGFIVGLVARAIMPGQQRMGFIMTTLLGVGGSFAGGTLANVLMHKAPFGLAPAGFIGSVLGALILMFVLGLIRQRR